MTETDKMLTVEEVAKKLGKTRITIYSWIRNKKLPAYKIGKQYVILESELENYFKGCQTIKGEKIN